MLGYWRFFPTEEGWGRIPVMGCAPDWPPGVPLWARPKTSLLTAPSIEMLL
ncbi:MAG: hypothetical protein ABFS41_06275 [Myxococcota bacterium]